MSPIHKWSVFIGTGWSNYLNGTNNNTFIVSPTETDQLAQTSGGNSADAILGFARNYPLNLDAHISNIRLQKIVQNIFNVLQSISIGATFRYDPSTLNGWVYQFQDPTQNNYTYQYQVRPLTQLAESDLVFRTIKKIHLSPFIVAGIGITESNLTYTETVAQQNVADATANNSNWVARPDIAIGAGLLWDIKQKKYFMKTQYLYQWRGQAHVNIPAFTQGVPISLNEQSIDVLFGYRFP